MENRNIFDYCAGVKSNNTNWYTQTCVVNGEIGEVKLQKVVRYYISTEGCKIIKHYDDGSREQVNAGRWLMTIFNQYEKKEWKNYKVDDRFYLDAIYAEIANIKPAKSAQISMF
jgi:hypothetical protein